MGVVFEAIASNFDEHLDDSRSSEEVATELALGKAMAVARRYPDCVVIGSDTIVTIEGHQLEKPRDAEEAHELLKILSGKPNDVSTGVAVMRLSDNTRLIGADTTKVIFKPYDKAAVDAYVATGDPLDKAGAYGIQSGAAPLIDHIEGYYDTVIGLPTHVVARFLEQIGITARPITLTPPVHQVM